MNRGPDPGSHLHGGAAVPMGAERAHPAGPEEWWQEGWDADWATSDGTLGGHVRWTLTPHRGVAWFWAAVAGPGRSLVLVVEQGAAPPRRGSLELRAEGLWADHIVETPLDHVSIQCEAFAVALDDPAAALGEPRGDLVPLGLDLEWETERPELVVATGPDRFEVACRVHGEVLVGDQRHDVDGTGRRTRTWGPARWWTHDWTRFAAALDDGTHLSLAFDDGPRTAASPPGQGEVAGPAGGEGGARLVLPGPGGDQVRPGVAHGGDQVGPVTHGGVGHIVPAGGGGVVAVADATLREGRAIAGRLLGPAEIRAGGRTWTVEPLADAPVWVTASPAPTGATAPASRLVRTLCRVRSDEGAIGHGWFERNRPA
ncbi:MAG: hypothetical protein AB7L84_13900 [Acidimicrobiia bacterium]